MRVHSNDNIFTVIEITDRDHEQNIDVLAEAINNGKLCVYKTGPTNVLLTRNNNNNNNNNNNDDSINNNNESVPSFNDGDHVVIRCEDKPSQNDDNNNNNDKGKITISAAYTCANTLDLCMYRLFPFLTENLVSFRRFTHLLRKFQADGTKMI